MNRLTMGGLGAADAGAGPVGPVVAVAGGVVVGAGVVAGAAGVVLPAAVTGRVPAAGLGVACAARRGVALRDAPHPVSTMGRQAATGSSPARSPRRARMPGR